MTCRIVVMLSGSGTTLQALLDYEQAGQAGNGQIVGVFSNQPHAYGLQRARQAGVASRALDHSAQPEREAFDASVLACIQEWQPDLVVLAGYMRILSPAFVDALAGQLLNIHPSLLPLYPGLQTHQRALAAGDRRHGSTVHFVTSELDGGPQILQGEVTVQPDDTPASLQARVQSLEWQLYPRVVRWYADGRLRLDDQGRPWLDGARLPVRGLNWSSLEPPARASVQETAK